MAERYSCSRKAGKDLKSNVSCFIKVGRGLGERGFAISGF